jgi:hypothetical protein
MAEAMLETNFGFFFQNYVSEKLQVMKAHGREKLN